MRVYFASIGLCALFLYACTNAIQPTSVYLVTQKINEDTPVYTLHEELPQLRGFTNGAVQKIVNETLKSIAEDQKQYFLNDIPSVDSATGTSLKSGLTVTYKTSTISDDFLSILFISSPYIADAAHPNHTTLSYNYDLMMKKEVFLNDLFKADDFLLTLSTLTIEQLTDQSKAAGTYFDGKDKTITEGAAPTQDNYDVFTIQDGQLVLYFDPYQVGPYAEGIQTVRFSKNDLNAHLSDLGKSLLQ